jgi:hypothetical protein
VLLDELTTQISMSHSRRWLFVIATCLLLAGPVLAQKPTAERPTYAVGDRWVVDKLEYRLARVDGDRYVFESDGRNEIHLTRDLTVARVVRSGQTQYDLTFTARWPWPLQPGKFTQSRAYTPSEPTGVPRRGLSASNAGDYQVTTTVDAYEDVVVPAGRFKAFKVTEEFGRQAAGSYMPFWRVTYWYAADARRLMKVESSAAAVNLQVTALEDGSAVASRPGTVPTPPPAVSTPAPGAPPPTAQSPPAARPASPAPAITPGDVEAPKIAINFPGNDARVEVDSIVVLGLVTDDVAVDRVQITINGVEVVQSRDVAALGRGVPIRVPAALHPGANVIEISAADKAGNVSQVVRTVTRSAPLAAPPPPAPVRISNRWAVVVGVGEYDSRAIPRLRFAARDAEAMHTYLTTHGGYPKENVVLLTDSTAQKPTLLNIKRALGDFLARRAGRDDMVLIYFAGHGAPEVDAAGAEGDGLSKYLIPRDADPDSLYTTALPMDEIQRIFARVQAERIVMLLDTCYSGTAGGRTFARASTRATGINDQFLERLTRSRGRVIITASGPNEVALELAELGHGVFTHFVLEGLRGKADRNRDGIVTVSELYEYVEDQVDTTARRAGGRQRPLMKGEIEGTLPLSRVAR